MLHTEGLDCAETQTTSRGHHVKPALRTVWGVRCIRSEGDVKPEFREEGLVRPETKCVFRRAARWDKNQPVLDTPRGRSSDQ